MMQTYGSDVSGALPAELGEPERAQMLLFPGNESLWISDMAGRVGSREEAFRLLSGHELGHWVWSKKGFGALLRPALASIAPRLSALRGLLDSPVRLAAARDLAGLPKDCNVSALVRVFLTEMSSGAEEAFADCVGAMAAGDPVRAAEQIFGYRAFRENCPVNGSAMRYRCGTRAVMEQAMRLAGAPAGAPGDVMLEQTAAVCIEQAAAVAHSWLATRGRDGQTAQAALLALCAAADGFEGAACAEDAKARFDCAEEIPVRVLELAAAVLPEFDMHAQKVGDKPIGINYSEMFEKKRQSRQPGAAGQGGNGSKVS